MIYQNIPLSQILPYKEYVIDSITDTKNGSLSLQGYGLIPGAKIKLLFVSPLKEPLAYEIMGTVLALRRKDAECIQVSPVNT